MARARRFVVEGVGVGGGVAAGAGPGAGTGSSAEGSTEGVACLFLIRLSNFDFSIVRHVS